MKGHCDLLINRRFICCIYASMIEECWECRLLQHMSYSGSNMGTKEGANESGSSRNSLLVSSSDDMSSKAIWVVMETTREVKVDPVKEHAESDLPLREGYAWIDPLVRKCFSKFRWSRILKSWLNSIC